MLAYLDDMLEPADAEVIGQKVAESEFASSVVHRIRDVTRRLRLEAPRLRGRSMGVDPNTVAEYLDSTLSPERVPEFEKLCLESDVYLAEVASCHQILTLVLAEPAEVPQETRQRMYDLIRSPIPPGQAADGADEYAMVAEEARIPSPIVERARPEVPEYLREAQPGRNWLWQIAALVGLVGLISGAVWMAVRPETPARVAAAPEQPAAAPLLGERGAALAEDGAGPLETTENLENAPAPAGGGGSSPAEDTNRNGGAMPPEPGALSPVSETNLAPEGAEPAAGQAEVAPHAEAALEQATAPAPPEPASSATEAALPRPVDPVGTLTIPSPSLDGPRPAETIEDAAGLVDADQPPLPGADGPRVAEDGASETAAPPAGEPAAGPTDVAERLSSPPKQIGLFVSGPQVLLHRDPTSGQWQRLASRKPIYSGDLVVTPPTYRATVTLTVSLTAQLLGGTRVQWLETGRDDLPGMRIEAGRVVLMNVGRAGTSIQIEAGAESGVLTFADAESSVALEVVPQRTPGTDPEQVPSEWVTTIYADSGEVNWTGSRAAEATVTAPAIRRLLASGVEPLATLDPQFPEWIAADRLKPIEEKASTALEQALVDDRPTTLRLRELTEQRKEEVRALALCTLAAIDDFGSAVAFFDDAKQRSYWAEEFEALKRAVALSPENAARIRNALVDSRGADKGRELYRMLWGYSTEQLQGPEGRRLVGYLDDDDQVFRVLAFQNLQAAAGKSLSYRPDDSAVQRRSDVQRWKELYESGHLGAAAKSP